MAAFGEDFGKLRGPSLYRSGSITGLWTSIALTVVIALVYLISQSIAALVVALVGFHGGLGDPANLIKSSIIGVLPAAIPTAAFIWWISKYRGANARDVLALRFPRLGWLGWLAVVFGFLLVMYALVILIVFAFQIDVNEMIVGPDGQSQAQDLIKQGMQDLVQQPALYWLAFLSVAVGAPIGEELIFRGYMFSWLSKTRVGLIGAALLTSAAWAMIHKGTGPWYLVGILFVMGLVLSSLLIRFGSLWITMVCHGVWNAITALTIFAIASK
jgi:uncharacterized protein